MDTCIIQDDISRSAIMYSDYMNKTQAAFFQLALLSIPVIIGYLYGLTQEPGSVFGLIVWAAIFIGWPFILITGGIVSRLTKNSKHPTKYQIAAYTIPTFFVVAWELGSLLGN